MPALKITMSSRDNSSSMRENEIDWKMGINSSKREYVTPVSYFLSFIFYGRMEITDAVTTTPTYQVRP